MKFNKQSNIYTVCYIIGVVLLVGTALAITSTTLKPRQDANAKSDKMKQILASVNIPATDKDAISLYKRYITGEYIVSSDGNLTKGEAFDIDVAKEIKLPESRRQLPMFECTLPEGEVKYIIPMYGAGLWGPIWGYISVDSNGSTIYGAFFAHQGETPGLGAEIEKSEFRNEFKGLNLFTANGFAPVSVVKAGQPSPDGSETVNAISGGTITSKGVDAMIHNCLNPYKKFLEDLKNR